MPIVEFVQPSLADLAPYFNCPDDGSALAAVAGGFQCTECGRAFPALSPNVMELLPSRSFSIPLESTSAEYRDGYLREFVRPMEFRKGANAWGAPEGLPLRWTQLRQRQAREVLDFLRDESVERKEVFCDLSAGAGYCTFEASQKYRVVFHCDLSADSLAYAAAKAKRNQLENIIFVRADYFQPPFRNAIHHLVCLDTLIRGPWHEAAVLASVRRILASRGVAVVDFHNWWHNPLRRMGILRENFRGNKSYTRKELKKLLVATGINRFRTKGFIQEVDPAHVSGQILSRWIPPTRLMVRLERESVSPS